MLSVNFATLHFLVVKNILIHGCLQVWEFTLSDHLMFLTSIWCPLAWFKLAVSFCMHYSSVNRQMRPSNALWPRYRFLATEGHIYCLRWQCFTAQEFTKVVKCVSHIGFCGMWLNKLEASAFGLLSETFVLKQV